MTPFSRAMYLSGPGRATGTAPKTFARVIYQPVAATLKPFMSSGVLTAFLGE